METSAYPKEMSARFLVTQIECTMRQENKHALGFLHFQRMKSFVEFGQTVWRESRERRFPYNQGNCGL